MKNNLKLVLFVCISLFATATFAQSKAQMTKLKQRLMAELKIDNTKADSVVNVVQDFYINARAVRTNANLKDDERKAALQNNRKEEMLRLRSQLNNEQIKQLQQVVQEMKQQNQSRTGRDSVSAP